MRKTIGKLFLILMLLVIYAPILILAVYSFTDSGNLGSIHGFSMQNYVTLGKSPLNSHVFMGTQNFTNCICKYSGLSIITNSQRILNMEI